MDKSELKENIRRAVESYKDHPHDLGFADGVYESFVANPKLMAQLPDLSYGDLESYLHDKIRNTAELLTGLDDETLRRMTEFPIPTKKV